MREEPSPHMEAHMSKQKYWSSCPNHTKHYVQIHLWSCWELYSKLDVGPPLSTLLHLEMPTDGVKTGWCDQPLKHKPMARPKLKKGGLELCTCVSQPKSHECSHIQVQGTALNPYKHLDLQPHIRSAMPKKFHHCKRPMGHQYVWVVYYLLTSLRKATLHTRLRPMSIALQALSSVENSYLVMIRSKFAWGTNGVCECNTGAKSTRIPTWHQIDHVSRSLRLFSKISSSK